MQVTRWAQACRVRLSRAWPQGEEFRREEQAIASAPRGTGRRAHSNSAAECHCAPSMQPSTLCHGNTGAISLRYWDWASPPGCPPQWTHRLLVHGIDPACGPGRVHQGQRAARTPAQFKDREIYLYFGGLDESCTVYVSGKEAGQHRFEKPDDWNTPFEILIDPLIGWAQPTQVISVRVEDKGGAGGIRKTVWMVSKLKPK